MAFHVGQKVVMIGRKRHGIRKSIPHTHAVSLPNIGDVCTIREMRVHSGKLFLLFVEHDNSAVSRKCLLEPGFWAANFRPVTDTKSSISFTQGAPLDSEQYDNRRRHPAKVPS